MSRAIRLFLAGDVMTGRGIDQVLPHPSDPVLYESYIRDARDYVELAERVNGPISRRVDFRYIWGDALATLARVEPDVRIVNLETSVTVSDARWRGKGIHYRMHPGNTECLTAAALDCCVLANNHVLDFGVEGLDETLSTLQSAGLPTAGAGRNLAQARAPAVIDLRSDRRVLVFAGGSATSGVPQGWAAAAERPGVNRLPDSPRAAAAVLADSIKAFRKPGDVIVVSIHWGGNWGYEIPDEQRALAHRLVDAGVDVVHGHSSHHAKGIEIYRGSPIIYGSGDFVNDYEGISGRDDFRGDLRLGYFIDIDPSGTGFSRLDVVPFRARRFRLQMPTDRDVAWVGTMLGRESEAFGVRVERKRHDTLSLSAAGA